MNHVRTLQQTFDHLVPATIKQLIIDNDKYGKEF